MRILSWIGGQRARALPVLVLVGIGVPPVGAVLRPYVTEAVVGLLCVAFLRLDAGALRSHLRRPALVVLGTAWTILAVPVLFWIACRVTAVSGTEPDLYLGLMLQAAASPMMAAPALAALMGLDATLALATLTLSSTLLPISAPVIVGLLGLDLALSPWSLAVKLLGILGSAAAAGLLMRRLLGTDRVARHRDAIDGINIIILFVFISAVMGEVGIDLLERPLVVVALATLAFLVFALLLATTFWAFRAAGAERAFALAMVTAQKNMGLMLAATGGALPDLTWLYFALGQFPIYLSPYLLQGIARSVTRKDRPGG